MGVETPGESTTLLLNGIILQVPSFGKVERL